MKRNDVRPLQQVVQLYQIHMQLLGTLIRQHRVVRNDIHAEGQSNSGDVRADASQADQAEHLASKLSSTKTLPVPLPFAHAGGRPWHSSHQGQQQGECMFRRAHRVGPRGVDHRNAAPGGCLHIDIVDTDTGTPDHAQVRCVGQQLLCHPGRRANQERLGAGQLSR